MGLIFKTEMVTYQSKANLDEIILFGKITRWENVRFILVHDLLLKLKFYFSH